jgi:anti-sigma factor RsiW
MMEDDMRPDPTTGLSDDELADLARLVDGTLSDDRRAEVEARVAASPQLSAIVAAQTATLGALAGSTSIGAPARLRADVDRRRAGERPASPRRRMPAFVGALAGLAAVALVLVLALPGVVGSGPSVADAAALATKPPTDPAPAPVPGTPQILRASVDGVPFPNYRAKFGWAASGRRADDPSGRDATTVQYGKGARTIAYTIVSGDALDPPEDARTTTRGGVEYRSYREDGRNVVTWERGGRTCVLSSAAVPSSELITLADWRGKGAIPF